MSTGPRRIAQEGIYVHAARLIRGPSQISFSTSRFGRENLVSNRTTGHPYIRKVSVRLSRGTERVPSRRKANTGVRVCPEDMSGFVSERLISQSSSLGRPIRLVSGFCVRVSPQPPCPTTPRRGHTMRCPGFSDHESPSFHRAAWPRPPAPGASPSLTTACLLASRRTTRPTISSGTVRCSASSAMVREPVARAKRTR